MKVLTIYCNHFGYKPGVKNLEKADDCPTGASFDNVVVAFIQVEAQDEENDLLSREKKLVNQLKWVLRKNKATQVVLHSFAHLSESKASAEFSKKVFDAAEQRLRQGGYITAQTPFGYFLDLEISAPGFSLARIWAGL